MPNRILRDGILESRAVNSLPDDAQILYYRLFSIVDDFGRYEAAEDILRAKCFPLLLDRWPPSRVSEALSDVCQKQTSAGVSLITLYEVSGKKYLQINNFNQRVRSEKSKWPSPDGHMSVNCPTDDVHPHASRARSSPSPSPNMTLVDSEKEKEQKMIDGIFEEIYAAHPKKSGKVLAMHALSEACSPPVEDPVAQARMIQTKHAEWLPEFKRDGGKFAPQLHRWIAEQKYLDDPPVPAEPQWDWRKAALGIKQ